MSRLWFSRIGYSLGRLYSSINYAPLALRPYQEECLNACLDALKQGHTRIGVSLPTGSGKTTVFLSLLSRMGHPSTAPEATRSLVITNSQEITQQTLLRAREVNPGWVVEVEQGAQHASGQADVTVATTQSLLNPERLKKFDARFMKAIIVDECHHATAPSYMNILSHFHPAIEDPDGHGIDPGVPIFGFSGTFSRHDSRPLASVFQTVAYHKDLRDLIQDGWLCKPLVTIVKVDIDVRDVDINPKTNDFNTVTLSKVVNTPEMNALVIQSWREKAADRKSTLVFCLNLDHLANLTSKFRAARVEAHSIDGNMPAAQRKELLDAFRAGRYPVLLNCAVMTEGVDIPNIDCIVVARPTRSRNVYTQMIGRGLRLSPETGKHDCRVIDFVDRYENVMGIVTLPRLFAVEPDSCDDDEHVRSLLVRAERVKEKRELEGLSSATTEYSNILDLNGAAGQHHIAWLSEYAWFPYSEDVYLLPCYNGRVLRVQLIRHPDREADPSFAADYVQLRVKHRSTRLHLGPRRADAIRACDEFLQEELCPGSQSHSLFRRASWRADAATWEQTNTIVDAELQKRPTATHDAEWEEFLLKIRALTKGEAVDMICSMVYRTYVDSRSL
ncbi:P-loop containing nucleoside triphosphate hydrolase protein [Daedaleopsis nitida]|nr:P-loop containing nucleoside triphosphate hydrolase protein [Daedaleopsis nitida]